MENVSRDEFNGLGKRVSHLEQLDPQVKRNTQDIKDWASMILSTKDTIAEISVHVEEKLDRAKWQILVMVCIPIILFILNIYLTIKMGISTK